jgi:hypothetical protein
VTGADVTGIKLWEKKGNVEVGDLVGFNDSVGIKTENE